MLLLFVDLFFSKHSKLLQVNESLNGELLVNTRMFINGSWNDSAFFLEEQIEVTERSVASNFG